MNSGLKKFSDIDSKEAYEVITQNKELNVHNFSIVRRRMISANEVVRKKNKIVSQMVNVAQHYLGENMNPSQVSTLRDDPLEFRMKKSRGDSAADSIEASLQEISARLIEFLFYYQGLLKLNDFLLERCNNISRDYNGLAEEYEAVVKDNNMMREALNNSTLQKYEEIKVAMNNDLVLCGGEEQETEQKDEPKQQEIQEEEPEIEPEPQKEPEEEEYDEEPDEEEPEEEPDEEEPLDPYAYMKGSD